jgi:hypothetical protein
MEAESNGWIRQFMAGCYPSMTALILFLQQRNAVFGALVSPLATRERARGIIDFYQYVTVFDDMCGAGTQVGSNPGLYSRVRGRLVGAFSETTSRDDHPFILGGLDLLRRLNEGMSSAQQQRLIKSVADFGKGIEWEVFSISQLQLFFHISQLEGKRSTERSHWTPCTSISSLSFSFCVSSSRSM